VIRVGAANGTESMYEERITVWRATSLTEAIARGESDATEYAADIAGEYVGLAQGYHIADDLGDGAEVFSLIRDSPLDPDTYIDRFFDTGVEHQTFTE
jgi:hypothetical protein